MNEAKEEVLKMSYEVLRRIIFDYFKATQDAELSSISINYLKGKLAGTFVREPFFIKYDEFGETRFDLSKDDVKTILELYLANSDCRLLDLNFGDMIEIKYKPDSKVKQEMIDSKKNVELDLTLNGKMDYGMLRRIIFDYFSETYGFELSSISIDYLKSKLAHNTTGQPFFIKHDEFGETRFDISPDDIKTILELYMANSDYRVSDIKFDDFVRMDYKPDSSVKQEMLDSEKNVELDLTLNGRMDYEMLREIIFRNYKEKKDIQLASISIDYLKSKLAHNTADQPFFIRHDENGETRFDIPKEEIREILEEYLKDMGYELMDLNYDSIDVKFTYKPIEKEIQKEQTEEKEQSGKKKTFSILKKVSLEDSPNKGKAKAAAIAGTCILGAVAAAYFSKSTIGKEIRSRLSEAYAGKEEEYFIELGPLTTLLATGAATFAAKYLKESKILDKIQSDFIEFNDSLENEKSMGGNDNAKSI